MLRLKQGAILYNEAEMFSLPITNPNGLPMFLFDWLTHSVCAYDPKIKSFQKYAHLKGFLK